MVSRLRLYSKGGAWTPHVRFPRDWGCRGARLMRPGRSCGHAGSYNQAAAPRMPAFSHTGAVQRQYTRAGKLRVRATSSCGLCGVYSRPGGSCVRLAGLLTHLFRMHTRVAPRSGELLLRFVEPPSAWYETRIPRYATPGSRCRWLPATHGIDTSGSLAVRTSGFELRATRKVFLKCCGSGRLI